MYFSIQPVLTDIKYISSKRKKKKQQQKLFITTLSMHFFHNFEHLWMSVCNEGYPMTDQHVFQSCLCNLPSSLSLQKELRCCFLL